MSSDSPDASAGWGGNLLNSTVSSAGLGGGGFSGWLNGVGRVVTGGAYKGAGTDLSNAVSPPTTPDAQAPPAPPSAGSIRQGQITQGLGSEQQMYAASTILNGGQGLSDQPTTASRVLLGS